MHKCSSCNAAVATVEILDLEAGSVVNSHFLCDACAKTGGTFVKKTAIKLSSEILENLLGGIGQDEESLGAKGPSCPGCKLTAAEFRLRGRLGCPRCYEVFRSALLPLLERVHDASCHRGRFPGSTVASAPAPGASLVDLSNRLRAAIDDERYEDAAKLRDQLERARQEREAK